jgi:hypothetical protein
MDAFKSFIDSIASTDQKNRMVEILTWVSRSFPSLEQTIKWKQPMFTDHGTFIIAFSVAKDHLSFSPEEYGIRVFLEDIEKSGYKHTKGIVKIKWTDKIDYDLLHRVIQFNIEDKKNCKTFFRK